jgi:hypothetical protein
MATITIREHKVSKVNSLGLTVEKSLNQDMVFVGGKLAGYLTWPDKMFKPLSGIGWDNSHNKMIVDALQGLKGSAFGEIKSIDATDVELAAGDDDE